MIYKSIQCSRVEGCDVDDVLKSQRTWLFFLDGRRVGCHGVVMVRQSGGSPRGGLESAVASAW